MSWAVRVSGVPVAQGSMVCKGARGGKGRHVLVDSKAKALAPWRALLADGGRRLMEAHGLDLLEGPLRLEVTFTVWLPRSVKPAKRLWPHVRAGGGESGGGDLDKLVRAVGDAWSGVVYGDDAQVCEVVARKVHPHNPHPQALDYPGAVIRISTL